MGVLLAFAAGYVVAARGANRDFNDLSRAARAVLESDEMADFVKAARTHLGHTLRELGLALERADGDDAASTGSQDLVDRVKSLFARE
jgi:hypothetical protein